MKHQSIFLFFLSCLLTLSYGCTPPPQPGGTTVTRKVSSAFQLFPDRSTPEMTLRTFWWAVQRGDANTALACTDPERVQQGHHGRDVYTLIEEYLTIDASKFRFIGGAGPSCSIESPNHCMDYDMEKNENGEWVIVSIHP